MFVTKPRHRSVWVMLMALGAMGVLFHNEIVGQFAYAVEKGKIEANSEGLAKVESISNVFRMVAKSVKPAVVQIKTHVARETPKTSLKSRGTRPEPSEDFPEWVPEQFREFFEQHRRYQLPREQRGPPSTTSTGSGVIIDAEKGYILTNNHVVSPGKDMEARILVSLPDGREFDAVKKGADPKTDLALIQFKNTPDRLHAVPLGDSDAMEVGDWVLAIGAPFGLPQTVTQGIISAKDRSRVGIVDYEDFLQTDAAINPGNSGGPLVNMRGEVVGINTAIKTNPLRGGYMGIGFAIPSNMIEEYLPRLIEGKEIERGYLGVAIQGLRDDPGLAENLGFDGTYGVAILNVSDDGPADKAGLKIEDVILEINGEKAVDHSWLARYIQGIAPGTEVTMKVLRDGKQIEVKVKIEKQPPGFSTFTRLGPHRPEQGDEGKQEDEALASVDVLGLTIETLSPSLAKKYGWEDEKSGVVVTEVEPLSEADVERIQEGDLIVAVQGKAVRSARSFRKMVTAEALKKGIRFRVKTRFGNRLLLLQVDEPRQSKSDDDH